MTNLQNEQLNYICEELQSSVYLTESAHEQAIQDECDFIHGFKPTQEEINDTLFELGQ